MAFDLSNYETVEDRLIRFWADHPNGRIATQLVAQDGDQVIFRAEVFFEFIDTWPKATGHAEEIRGSSMVNKTSALENCETSAIGRALANYQYQGGKKRSSLEEVVKVYRQGGQLSASGPTTSTNSEGPTAKQLAMLRAKNWEGAVPETKREASQLIDRLMNGG